MDTLSLFINTDLLGAQGLQPPATWEDFVSEAKKLTVPDETGLHIKTAGAGLGSYDNITHASDIIALLFAQNGVNVTNIGATAQSATDALNFYTSFDMMGDNKVWDDSLDSSILAFSKGNLAMYFGYSWDVFTIKAANPALNFKIYPVPHLPSRNITIASYWAQGVSVKTKHQKEALAFLKYLSSRETQQKLYAQMSKTRLFGQPYALVDLGGSLKENELVYPFISQAPGAISSYFVSNTFDDGLNSQMDAYLGNAVRSILANNSAQTAVDTLSQGTSQVLKQYGAN